MSRCSICDYSQSADSLYNDGVALSYIPNNRVVYNAGLGKDICVSCLEDHFQQKNYWTAIDGMEEDVLEVQADEDSTDYNGCTEVKAD